MGVPSREARVLIARTMLCQGYDDDDVLEHLLTDPDELATGPDAARTACTLQEAANALKQAYRVLNDRPNDTKGLHIGLRRAIIQKALRTDQLHVALQAADSLADMEGIAFGAPDQGQGPLRIIFEEVGVTHADQADDKKDA